MKMRKIFWISRIWAVNQAYSRTGFLALGNDHLNTKSEIKNVLQIGQYIGGQKVVTSRSALAILELYCHDIANKWSALQ